MNKLVYLPIFLVPCLLHTTSTLITRTSATQGYSVHPQQGNTGNFLDILAGDTRALVGNALLGKAETYYHGGIGDHGDCTASTGGEHSDHDGHDDPVVKKQTSSPRFDP